MFKKSIVLSFILSFLLAFSFPLSVYGLADDEITAPAAVLMEPETGKVLYEKNAHEVRACASITKVMTLLLVFEAIDAGKIGLEDTVTTSAHAQSMGGSDIWLVEGETMTVHEMLKATVVASANDAAVALAEHVSGTEDEFVAQMNARAQELGMKETVFKNCNGLDEEGHVTSAYDVAVMSCALMKHEKIFEYTTIWLDHLRNGETQIVNTNKLLKSYTGITGLKTGTTNDAGSCISATAARDGLSLNAVVLGAKTGTERFKDAATLLDYGFANYQVTELEKPAEGFQPMKVEGGMDGSVTIDCEVNQKMLMPKGSVQNFESTVNLPETLTAPVELGQKVGTLTYKVENKTVAEFPIVTTGQVEEMNFGAVFKLLFSSLLAL